MRAPPYSISHIVSISLLLPLWLLGGCAGTKEAVLPQDGPPMQAILGKDNVLGASAAPHEQKGQQQTNRDDGTD